MSAPEQLKPTHSVEIKELLRIADRKFTVRKGEYLFREGTKAEELYVISSGKIQITKTTAEGRRLCLRISGKNEICGELTLFTDDPRYFYSAEVIEEADVYAIHNERLETALFHDKSLAFEFIKWMSDHVRKTQTKFRDLVLIGRKGALYSTLIRMTNSYGVRQKDGILIDLSLTDQQLADFCGISRESTNRILNDLKRKHVISNIKKKIVVHDLQYLKDAIGCEECPVVYCSIE